MYIKTIHFSNLIKRITKKMGDVDSLISQLGTLDIKSTDTYAKFISENKEKLSMNLQKAIKGYHVVSKEPIKEARWEEINEQVFKKSNCNIIETASGSHMSGCDIRTEQVGNLSNKTSKIKDDVFNISSYRLSSVCHFQRPGEIKDILEEITKKSKSYENYSILLREDIDKTTTCYKWLIIPKTLDVLNSNKYEWSPMIGKRGPNKGLQVGWCTNVNNGCSMKITFSMSSQLWINISLTPTMKEKYIIGEVIYNKKDKEKQIDYIDLFDLCVTDKKLE